MKTAPLRVNSTDPHKPRGPDVQSYDTFQASPPSSLPAHRRYQEKLFFGSSHWWARERLQQLSPSMYALDIGPGSGVMGHVLAALRFPLPSAVEIDPDARKHVMGLYSEVAEELHTLTRATFDLVFLLDVLEHMAAPVEYLRELQAYLTPQSTILISVPNFAHWSVRLPLLFGYFRYFERGILDKTHLHFFSRASLLAELSALPAFTICSIAGSIEPLEFVLPAWMQQNVIFRVFSRLRWTLAQILPGLFAYQILVELKYAPGNDEISPDNRESC